MRQLTTLEVIRALPIEPATKEKLVAMYPTMDTDTQLEVSQTCWAAFHNMKKIIEDYYRQHVTQDIANGTRTSEPDPEIQVAEEAWKEIENRITGKAEDDEKLSSIRSQLENLIHDSHTS